MKRSHGPTPLIPSNVLHEALAVRASTSTLQGKARPADSNKSWFRIENKSSSSADVYIYDEIGYWGTTAQGFIDEIKSLDVSVINLHLNSPGGDVFDGTAIYNAIKSHKAKVTVYVDALAASAASFIAQAGDNVIMTTGSTMMIHDASSLCWGNAEDMAKTGVILDKISDNIASIYAARTGETSEFWRAFMKEEVWYTAEEAVAAGLADIVAGASDAEDVEDKWDFSVFAHAGRAQAPSPETIRSRVIHNAVKESPVTKPKNETTAPEVEPVVGEPDEVEADEVETVVPVVAPDAEPITPAPVAPTEGAPAARAGAVIINGVAVTDVAKIQAHIAGLEQFANEAKTAGRASFLDSLVKEGKLPAPQRDKTDALMQTFSDEQYDLWKASWDDAPKLALFGNHTANGTGEQSESVAASDRISVCEAIIAQHRRTGRPEAEIEKLPSYLELQALKAQQA